MTPLDITEEQIRSHEDSSASVGPDTGPWYEIRDMLVQAGGVQCRHEAQRPSVRPDGSVLSGDVYGPPSELRAHNPPQEGSDVARGWSDVAGRCRDSTRDCS